MKKSEMNRMFDLCLKEFPPEYEEHVSCPHIFCLDEGMYICARCHRIERNYVEGFVEYKDRPSVSVPYDKTSHFKQKLDEISGLSMLIPEEVMKVCLGMDQEAVKIELHRHKLKKYYSSIYLILRQKGIHIPVLYQTEKDKLIQLFKQVETIYSKVKKKTNMISYHFILSKLLPMIKRDDLVPWLFKLHSRRKIKEYNVLWSKILDGLH
jgi:hypothetical protein